MVAKEFHPNDLVWAKMKGFPHWPAKISTPPTNTKESAKKGQHYVLFFGSENYSWIKDEMIEHHSEKMLDQANRLTRKSKDFMDGMEKIKVYAKTSKKSMLTKEVALITEEPKVNESVKSKPSTPKPSTPKPSTPKPSTSKPPTSKPPTPKTATPKKIKTPLKDKKSQVKKLISVKIQSPRKAMKRTADSEAQKSPVKKRRSLEEESKEDDVVDVKTESDEIQKASPTKVQKQDDDFALLFQSIAPNNAAVRQQVAIIQPYEKGPKTSLGLLDRRAPFEKEKTPELDVEKGSIGVISRNIQPTKKKIGFIGLGLMGRGIVRNLINTGHNVTVWNRNFEKCEMFVKMGAQQALTPSDVAIECDIIFSCLSDPETCKDRVFGNCGILQGLQTFFLGGLQGLGSFGNYKGYVEMTSIDPTTSEEMAEAITQRGGRYLEASLLGDRQLSEDGNLLIISAGDGELFQQCESCFSAISKKAYYLSCEVGIGVKMNLVVSMLIGTNYAALAEAMALSERCKLNNSNFLDLLELSLLGCPLLKAKAKSMISKKFVTSTAIKHQQKDMNLAVTLAHTKSQPLPCSSAANELFKRAKLLSYSDHDVAALVFAALY